MSASSTIAAAPAGITAAPTRDAAAGAPEAAAQRGSAKWGTETPGVLYPPTPHPLDSVSAPLSSIAEEHYEVDAEGRRWSSAVVRPERSDDPNLATQLPAFWGQPRLDEGLPPPSDSVPGSGFHTRVPSPTRSVAGDGAGARVRRRMSFFQRQKKIF